MSEPRSFRDELALLLKARFPILYVESHEERRVLGEIRAVAADPERMRTPRPVWTWSATTGLTGPDGAVTGGTTDASRALDAALRQEEPALFVFLDLHAALGSDHRGADAGVVRRLRDLAAAFQSGAVARTLVIVAPERRIPEDLSKDVTIVDFPLPTAAEIRATLDAMIDANAHSGRIRVELDEQGRQRLASAARGLTLQEAENAFARAIVADGTLTADDVRVVTEEKRQTIRKSGVLEFIAPDLDLSDVGGLQNLKRWLLKRDDSWLPEAADYGLPAPKGVLITGVPGCGKSLTAKSVASAWQLPLLRLDVGRVFSGLVGSSEQNMRSALRAAEAIAPCILWIDEIEKGFSGTGAGAHDSGTSARVFGSFLSWMQDKSAPVFVIATANNIEALPPEFLRKGRFDEIFFVDLPTAPERVQIWRLHLERRLARPGVGGALAADAATLDGLAAASEGYSGAEIEQAVIAALFDAYAERRPLELDDLRRSVATMVPLSITMAPQIAAIREWASVRAVAATASEDRAGYTETPIPAEAPPPARETPGEARGGRLVDF
jgi:ATP-dependent 26S proteasome regulatory subunit